jgi:peptidylprolyl isomerase
MRRSTFGVMLAAVAALSAVTADAQPRRQRAPAAQGSGPGPGDWRTPDPENVLVIDTTKGRIIVELEPRMAPAHVERVRTLTRQGFYNGRTFFRVIDGFMDQTGDPTETGSGGSTLPDLEPEFSQRRGADFPMAVIDHPLGKDAGFVGSLPVISEPGAGMALMADGRVPVWGSYCPGVLGMARAQAENTGNSQFFIMRATYPSLNRRYTAFGRVLSGMNAVTSIKVGEPVAEPRDAMTQVRVLADIPAAERPQVRVVDTASRWFAARAAQEAERAGAGFNICDLEVPVDIRDPAQRR